MLRRVTVLTMLALGVLLLPTMALSTATAVVPSWQTHRNLDNPLVGRIYAVADKTFLSPGELIDRLAGARFLLLGEMHDNADHHRLQAFVLGELAQRGRRPAIVMEQINDNQQGALKLFQSGSKKSAERLGPAIGWQTSGWPDWKLYQPIAETAFEFGLTIHAGDISKDAARNVGKNGLAVLGEAELQRLRLQQPLPGPLEGALIEDLVLSHCSMMPAERMRPMLGVQRYRDAHLARAVEDADSGDGTVLIAGNGHVRSDRAVPWYLRNAGHPSLSLMIVEASADAGDPLALVPNDPAGKPAADYVWVTPGATRDDPCEGLAKKLRK